MAIAGAAIVLAAAGVAAPALGSPALGSPARPAAGSARAGAQLWASRYNGPAGGADRAAAIAVSPDGRMAFVTGRSYGGSSGWDYATVGYSAATGARRWSARYAGPGNDPDAAKAVAVSPHGPVVVTGDSGRDIATVAYDAVTGRRLWARRYRGPGYRSVATSVAASPDGATVYVIGGSNLTASPQEHVAWAFTTIAYDAATGAVRWVARYAPHGGAHYSARSEYWAHAVAVSPDGGSVYVTGTITGPGGDGPATGTVAYAAATGARAWTSTDCCVPDRSMALSPDGAVVYTASISEFGPLIAYDAATGAELWESDQVNSALPALAVRPGGHLVVAAGTFVQAFVATSGSESWMVVPAASAVAIAFAPGGGALYVVGSERDRSGGSIYVTQSLAPATGAQRWKRTYAVLPGGMNRASAIVVNPVTGAVYVTGGSAGSETGQDYATVAYRG